MFLRRRRALYVLVAVSTLGASWQLADTARFTQAGFEDHGGWGFTLPFVHTTVDYQTVFQDAEWTRRMVADVESGKRLILAYNLSSYLENPTNPSGIPERLYVLLGPERFEEAVRFFGDDWRCDGMRARRTVEIFPFAESIETPDAWVGWYSIHPNDRWDNVSAASRRAEIEELFSALEQRFVLVWEPPLGKGPSRTQRFTLVERASTGDGAPYCSIRKLGTRSSREPQH
jgi:hypothetical protein